MKNLKDHLTFIFVVLIFCMPYSIFAQKNDLPIPYNVKELKISVKHIEGKVYINWKENDQRINSTYFIQRSDDGEEYDIIGSKNSIALEKPMNLAYFFVDTLGSKSSCFYIVIRIDDSSSELVACSDEKYIIQSDSDNSYNTKEDCCIYLNTAFNKP